MEYFIIMLLSVSAGFYLGKLTHNPFKKAKEKNRPDKGYKVIIHPNGGRAELIITDKEKWSHYMNRDLRMAAKGLLRRNRNETK